MLSEALDRTFEDLPVDSADEAEYVITPKTYELFLDAFDDRSPVHVDAGEARGRGFSGCVMHGAILNGFLSHFIGMRMPGRRALLLSSELQFSNPCYLHDRLRLRARVAQRVESVRTLVIHVRFDNETQGTLAAKGRVQV